jgi:Putative prokaryotic signal transducing protein
MPSKRLPSFSNWRQNVPRGIEGLAVVGEKVWSAVDAYFDTELNAVDPELDAAMKTIKTYSTRVEADLARIALEAAGVPSVVVGVGVGMEGGTGGVQLLVEVDRVERALKVLGDA